ncbi:MAG: hypothetical protein ABI478_06490 [Propionivibrio sp.]
MYIHTVILLIVRSRAFIVTVRQEAAMSSPITATFSACSLARIICPHCRRPIDPLTLECAVSAGAQYRICPACDEAIVLPSFDAEPRADAGDTAAEAPNVAPAAVNDAIRVIEQRLPA